MTDVLKIALERRSQLQDEVTKLDDFIRMAEALMSSSQDVPASSIPPQVQPSMPQGEPMVRTAMRRAQEADAVEGDTPRPSIIRRSANAAG